MTEKRIARLTLIGITRELEEACESVAGRWFTNSDYEKFVALLADYKEAKEK